VYPLFFLYLKSRRLFYSSSDRLRTRDLINQLYAARSQRRCGLSHTTSHCVWATVYHYCNCLLCQHKIWWKMNVSWKEANDQFQMVNCLSPMALMLMVKWVPGLYLFPVRKHREGVKKSARAKCGKLSVYVCALDKTASSFVQRDLLSFRRRHERMNERQNKLDGVHVELQNSNLTQFSLLSFPSWSVKKPT